MLKNGNEQKRDRLIKWCHFTISIKPELNLCFEYPESSHPFLLADKLSHFPDQFSAMSLCLIIISSHFPSDKRTTRLKVQPGKIDPNKGLQLPDESTTVITDMSILSATTILTIASIYLLLHMQMGHNSSTTTGENGQ